MKNILKAFGLAFFVLILINISPKTSAHTESENNNLSSIKASIVQPDLFVAEYKTPIWISVKDIKTDKVLNNLNNSIEIEKINSGIVAKDIVAKQKGEEYMFEFSFPDSGDYKIHFNISNSQFDFPIKVDAPAKDLNSENLAFYICSVLAVLVLIFGIVKKRYKLGIIWFLILLALGGLIYSVIFTEKQNPSNGIITCPKVGEDCVWTAHIHAYMPINICGEDFRLPTESGALNMPHTHEEKNLAHWHDQLSYDNEKKEVKNTEHLTVKAFFKEIKVPFSEDYITDKKNGNLCPNGKPATLKAFLNGKEKPDFTNYVWKDKDVIYFEFSDRSSLEIEKELKQKPVNFPVLGRG